LIESGLGPARIIWTDRHGGTSEPPYHSANLAHHVGDEPARVDQNRTRLASRLGLASPSRWCWLHQVHGANVVDATPRPETPVTMPEADAAVTRRRGVPLVVLTADCAPLALACDDAVAVVHAGWPGLLAGIVEAAVARLRRVGGGAVQAALGPCIHPARYAFGPGDLARLVERYGEAVAARTATGEPALDIPAAVRAALERAGVASLDDAGICTAASPNHFSYRRDGRTGRQALIALLEA